MFFPDRLCLMLRNLGLLLCCMISSFTWARIWKVDQVTSVPMYETIEFQLEATFNVSNPFDYSQVCVIDKIVLHSYFDQFCFYFLFFIRLFRVWTREAVCTPV